MIKKSIFLIILIVFLTMVYADGNAKDVPMEDIENKLIEETDLGKMAKCGNRNLMQFLNLDYQQYDEYLYYKGKEALSVDEALIVKAKNRDDLSAVKDAVENRIDSQITTYEGYGPSQVALLKNAVVTTKGKYLFYCTGKSAEKKEEVFESVI